MKYADYSRKQLIEEVELYNLRIAELETIQLHHESSEQALIRAESKLTQLNRELGKEIAERILRESALRDYSEKLAETNRDLGEALVQVQSLRRLVPLCSSCKNIRDDKGYWLDLEKYLLDYSGTEVTHTLCMPCVKDLYPDQYSRLPAEMRDSYQNARLLQMPKYSNE